MSEIEKEVRKVKRPEFATFLNVGTKALPVWERMGKGITGQTMAYNPVVSDEQYIDEESGYTSVDGYKPNIPTPQTAFKGNEVFDYVDKLRRKRATGVEVETEVLLVYIYNKTEVPGEGSTPAKIAYDAEKNKAVIQIDDFGGETSVVLNYTIGLNGDPVIGRAEIVDGAVTFTAS